MPITQDRMLTILDVAERLHAQIAALRDVIVETQPAEAPARLTPHIQHAPNRAVAEDLRDIQAKLGYLLAKFDETEVPLNLLLKLGAERAHFNAHAKQNERAARYQARKRGLRPLQDTTLGQGEARGEARGEAQPSATLGRSPQAAPVFDPNDPDTWPAPIPLTDELVAALLAEPPQAAKPAVPPPPPSAGDDGRSRGEAPNVPPTGADLFT